MLSQIRAGARKLRHYLMPRSAFRRIIATQAGVEVELGLLSALIDAKRAAIDVGANAGLYSLHLSRLVPQVYAFEPHPRMARILRANMPANVKVTRAAVSNVDGQARLRFPINGGFEDDVLGTIDSSNTAVVSADYRTVDVVTVRLDSWAMAPVGFIKIDVEGHEFSVLRGAEATLNRDKPTLLIEAEERHRPKAVESISAFLADHEYEGMFVLKGKLHALDRLDNDNNSSCRNTAEITAPSYVNNFIFAHQSQLSRIRYEVGQILQRDALQ
jgi:FkbM family methyltransferase